MDNANSKLLILQTTIGQILQLDSQGNVIGIFASLQKNLEPIQLIQGPENFVYVIYKTGNCIQKLDNQGKILDQYICPIINTIDHAALDAHQNFYVASTTDNKIVKFNESKNYLAEATVTKPNKLFLSRLRSMEKYIGTYNADTGKFSIFLTHDLSLFTEQFFDKGASSFLNSEEIDPELVYVTYFVEKKVITYKDHGGGFHLHKVYSLDKNPVSIQETKDGIYIGCSDSSIYIQRKKDQPFCLLKQQELMLPINEL